MYPKILASWRDANPPLSAAGTQGTSTMNKIICILSLAVLCSAWTNPVNSAREDAMSSLNCLGLSEAEKVLGQSALLKENSHETKNHINQYRCVFQATAQAEDPIRSSNLYYMLEVYDNEASAHEAYVNIRSANSGMEGQRSVDAIGEEAWFHTDGQNFHMIIFRRDNRMVRMKVNKLTQKSSFENLQVVARNIDTRMKQQ